VPTFIVRYEDLLSDPYNTLLSLFSFLLNFKEEDIKGSEVEKII